MGRYARSAGAEAIERVRELAADLRGLRVLHLNATPYGGGVAEILRSEVPLLRDLGLHADWQLISGDEPFFRVTKAIHNALQGAERRPDRRPSGRPISPTPRATRSFSTGATTWWWPTTPSRWRSPGWAGRRAPRAGSGAATSTPPSRTPGVWAFLRPFLEHYDAAVFTMPDFVPPDLPVGRVQIIPPAIDPESPKNLALPPRLTRELLEWIGVDVDRPLVTQVSRFDPWKDPFGVIAAYRLAGRSVPELQLGAWWARWPSTTRRGSTSTPGSRRRRRVDPGLLLFTNLTGVGNVEVNAFQRQAEVVIQKSLREGFGLVVSEAMWKGTPVVAGRAGGIPSQMAGGVGGFLVETVEECAERMLWLLRHPAEARDLGNRGRELVRRRFLLPRLLADELSLYRSLVSAPAVR